MDKITAMEINLIQNRIYEVRGYKVMLDYDLAVLYGVETKRLNEAVKRNSERFPTDFMFRLTVKEWDTIRSQFATASVKKNSKLQIVMTSQQKRNTNITPFAFTEHGVTIAASVLRSSKAIKMNIAIVRAFIELKQFIINYDKLAREIIELKEIAGSHNKQLNQIYEVLKNLMAEKTTQKKWEERERIGFKSNK
jgi:ORF6N domain